MLSRLLCGRALGLYLSASLAVFPSLAPSYALAQDDQPTKPEQHGRKYKAPPDTSRIEVLVIKGFNKKPIDGAHVIFHPVKDGVSEGNLEMKTHPDGKATIDVIPTGSSVRIQVLADGFATFADNYLVTESSRSIVISMQRPHAQVSTYIDTHDKPSEMQPGIQEPIRPKPATAAPSTPPAPSSATPAAPAPDSKPQQ